MPGNPWDSEVGLTPHMDSADEGLSGEDLRVYLLMFRRHLPLFLIVVAVTTALATIRTLNLQKVYMAKASIRLAKEPPDPAQRKYTMYWDGMPTEYLNSEIRDMQSLSLAAVVIQRNPEIKRQLENDLGTDNANALASAYLGGVRVYPEESTYVVDVGYQSPHPERCAPYANALAEAYEEQRLTLWGEKTRVAEESTAAISSELKATLRESQRRLDAFLDSHQSPLFERQEELLISRVDRNDRELDEVRLDRIRLDAELETIQRVIEQGRPLETAPRIADSPVVSTLRSNLAQAELELVTLGETYGESWPAVKQARARRDQTKLLLRQEIDLIVGQLESRRDKRISEEQDLAQLARELTAQSQSLAKRKKRYELLKSERDSNQRHLQEFSDRRKDISSYGKISVSNVRLVDPAIGYRRVSPNHASNVITGAGLGVVLGLVLVVLVDRLSDRVTTLPAATRGLQLSALGVVPHVSEASGRALDRFALVNSRSPFAESFRRARVQLNAMGALPESGCAVVLCGSGLPREGKTVCAANLAIASALAGKRTLLIDGDMRSPRVHTIFDTQLSPGLVDTLGGARPVQAVHDTDVDNLFLMPAGTTTQNPANLLARGTVFSDAIEQLKTRFDLIVIDSPPIAAFSDGTIMAGSAHATFLVVSARTARRSASLQARTELTRVGKEPCGIVFNQQDMADYGYYYGQTRYAYTDPDALPPADEDDQALAG